jgi:hypothetical protein
MKKMSVVLLCGYREREEGEIALFYSVLDTRIRDLKRMNFEVVCVLSGAYAEDQLRHCKRIADCELVFDTQENPNLATNLKAGLAGTDGAGCFVLPVEIPPPAPQEWETLREGWRMRGFLTETSIYKAAASQYGFPILVTRKGNSTIRELTGFRTLLDERLRYEDLATLD